MEHRTLKSLLYEICQLGRNVKLHPNSVSVGNVRERKEREGEGAGKGR
jgi:hypothetical protein